MRHNALLNLETQRPCRRHNSKLTVHCGKLVVHVHNGLTVVLPYISSKKYLQNNNVEYGVHYTLY